MSSFTPKKPILAVDIDEVLCDFMGALVKFHNAVYETSLSSTDFHSYSFHEVWGGTSAQCQDKMSLFFSSCHFLVGLQPVAGAQAMTKVLKEYYDLHLVTSRQHKLEEITRVWIRKHFPDTFIDIHFGNHYCEPGQKSIPKSELCKAINAVLLIDDSLTYAVDCSSHDIPVILFGNYAWNRGSVPEKKAHLVSRVNSWEGIHAAIEAALQPRLAIQTRSSSPHKSPKKALTKKIVVAVDVDEVLASFSKSLLDFYNEKHKKEYTVADIFTMRFHEVWGGTVEETNAIMDEFHESSHFLENLLPVEEQAFHHLGVLRDTYELHVVTARKKQVEAITRAWIDKHFPNIFTDIHFGNHYITQEEIDDYNARGLSHLGKKRSKSEMCKAIGARLLVDDNLDYAVDCAREGIFAILFGDYAWNKYAIDPSLEHYVHRVSSWAAVHSTIDSLLDPLHPHISPPITFYKPVVAVDIDEVLASFLDAMVTHYNEVHNTSWTTRDLDEKSDTCPILSGTDDEKTRQIDMFLASPHFRDGLLPVDEKAFHYLGVLRERYELHVVTARKILIEDVTRAWIEKHYPNIFTDIHFGNHYLTDEEVETYKAQGKARHSRRRHKSEICESIGAKLLIDDNINYATECAEKGIHVILFGDYSWNKGVIRTGLTEYITRTSSWAEVSDTIDAIMTEQRANCNQNRETGIIAAVQMCSTHNKARNRDLCARLIAEATGNGAQLVCLPECCAFMGKTAVETLGAAEDLSLSKYRLPLSAVELIRHQSDPAKVTTMQYFRELAVRNDVWLSLGGVQELRPDLGYNKISNAHVIIAPDGAVKAIYRKIHLFDAPSANLMESKTTAPGDEPMVVDMGFAKVGLSVCYDLRFPELYAHMRNNMGADVFLIPSAFTVHTGAAHWEVLLRSRAIENQCVVVAPAQYGSHNEHRTSYGHTMIVDPWGTVVGELPVYHPHDNNGSMTGESTTDDELFENSICYIKFDREQVRKIRSGMPIEEHHRYELYS